ncbi:MAG: amidohydrolase, partial [Alphaproteobacteria bacterium]|nr:amidohydrolase [Alphaproteobacteria bacterium]
ERGPNTVVHDLKGRTVIPGFVDAHSHFPGSAVVRRLLVDLNSPPIGGVTSIDDMIVRLSARAAALPAGAWLQGTGYDDTLIVEKRHPTRADLDRVATDRPIYVTHISGHLAAANSFALKLAGIDRATPQPLGGKFRIDPATGEPDGVLEETAMQKVSSLLPKIGDEDLIAAIGDASAEYASRGITTAQSGATAPPAMRQAITALEQGALSIRLNLWPVLGTPSLGMPTGQTMLAVTATKSFADGSIQGYTGYLSQPYHTHVHLDPAYRGYPRGASATLAKQVLDAHTQRRQLAIHANGDAAIDDVLAAYEAAQTADPWPDARHIVVHSQMAREDQLDRMAKLGVVPSFFVLHVYYWGDRHRDLFLGPDRAACISPTASALRRGIPFTLHADTPVVPMNPLLIIWAAVSRLTSSGKVLGPDQRLAPIDALRALTVNAARQERQEANRGSLEPGKFADFAVLDQSPLAVDPVAIRDIQVLETYLGGTRVFAKP